MRRLTCNPLASCCCSAPGETWRRAAGAVCEKGRSPKLFEQVDGGYARSFKNVFLMFAHRNHGIKANGLNLMHSGINCGSSSAK